MSKLDEQEMLLRLTLIKWRQDRYSHCCAAFQLTTQGDTRPKVRFWPARRVLQ